MKERVKKQSKITEGILVFFPTSYILGINKMLNKQMNE